MLAGIDVADYDILFINLLHLARKQKSPSVPVTDPNLMTRVEHAIYIKTGKLNFQQVNKYPPALILFNMITDTHWFNKNILNFSIYNQHWTQHLP